MRRIIIILSISVFIFAGCSHVPKGYVKFQTFDEYSMKGVNNKGNELKEPYVVVKTCKDSISVFICKKFEFKLSNYFNMDFSIKNRKYIEYGEYGENGEIITYINKGNYWYNIKKEQTDPKLYFTTKCDTVPYYIEKFIYNDTILTYSYYKDGHGVVTSESLDLNTRMNEIYLTPDTINISLVNKFNQLKEYFANYKSKYQYFKPAELQKSFYQFYNKILVGDTLYIYENNGKNGYKLGRLNSVLVLNSLGEFKKSYDTEITYKIRKEDLWK